MYIYFLIILSPIFKTGLACWHAVCTCVVADGDTSSTGTSSIDTDATDTGATGTTDTDKEKGKASIVATACDPTHYVHVFDESTRELLIKVKIRLK